MLLHFQLGFVFLVQTATHGTWKGIASHTLVGIALLVFLGIAAYHVYLKVLAFDPLQRRSEFWRRRVDTLDVANFEGVRGFERASADDETSEDESMIEASDRLVHFPPPDNASYDT